MPDFNVFHLLATGSSRIAIHNVRLVNVRPAEDGLSRLTVERAGETAELVGPAIPNWNQQHVGSVGYVVPMTQVIGAGGLVPKEACYFHPYLDQRMRRVPELDYVEQAGSRSLSWAGWRTDAQPGCFFAPAGLIPGEGGAFVPDETVEVTVRVPPEFVRECRRVQRSAEEVLRGFMADAAGLRNVLNRPRADGLSSNGSDEREMAAAWLERAYGMDVIDIDAAEAADDEREERQAELDDFGFLLRDYVDEGGTAADLVALVEAAIAKQRHS